VSNTRRARPQPREPDEVEAAFAAELKRGCPYCGSRTVTSKFRGGVWDFGLRCEPSCRTHAEPVLAHRIASEAAKRAAEACGQKLGYRALGDGAGRIEGAVIARAGG
jgi:hypothetical protein